MTQIIDIRPEHLETVKKILQNHLNQHATVWVFGSRAKGCAKKFSDLDLIVDLGKAVSLETMSAMAHDFEESNLPYKVDLVDWVSIDETFRELIKKDRILLWKGGQ